MLMYQKRLSSGAPFLTPISHRCRKLVVKITACYIVKIISGGEETTFSHIHPWAAFVLPVLSFQIENIPDN